MRQGRVSWPSFILYYCFVEQFMKIVFMGTPEAAAVSLERLTQEGHEIAAVYTQPDKAAGRGNKLTQSAVKSLALERGLRICQPTKLRTPEASEEFRSFAADVAVVVAYGRILPATFLDAFPMGAINVHFSLLPRYRGAAPVNWAIVNGESRTGVTTMQMDAGLDTGPILMQAETDIGRDETAIELMERLSVIGAETLVDTLTKFRELSPLPQDESLASYAPIMKKGDGSISWTLDAKEIANRVRGFQPFPSAFTSFRGKQLTIWKAVPEIFDREAAHHGEIICLTTDSFSVYCGGHSALRIEEVQPEGKRRMTARDFINGSRPIVGDTLGT